MASNILITGVNGDIGRSAVDQALAQGKQVYATVRNEAHRETFTINERLTILVMHVDDPASVKDAFTELDQLHNGEPLHAIVHCAAIEIPSTVEFLDHGLLEKTLKVNTLGSLAIMQESFPRLRASGGNLVIASSLWGFVAGPMVCAYAASKWALEALIHAARRETMGMGFSISSVNIGAVKSRMMDAHIDEVLALLGQAGEEERQFYGAAYQAHADASRKFNSVAITAEKVADKLLKIADSRKPASSYTVGTDARVLRFLNWILPTAVMDKVMGV